MRATVKNRIGVFAPQGFLDGNNAPTFLTLEDIRATEHLSLDMLLVSLKKVVFFNRNGLVVLNNEDTARGHTGTGMSLQNPFYLDSLRIPL